jgi:omega-6 fatty acid desaturase (delta-12 desaturase)
MKNRRPKAPYQEVSGWGTPHVVLKTGGLPFSEPGAGMRGYAQPFRYVKIMTTQMMVNPVKLRFLPLNNFPLKPIRQKSVLIASETKTTCMGNASNFDPAVLKRLPAIVKAYQVPDTKKAAIQLLTSFLPFFIIWTAMYLLVDVSIWLTFSLAIVNAFFLVRIFIIQHDCGHQSFTNNRRANDMIGQVCSFLSFIPYRYWAKSHNFHHGHNGILWEHRDIGDIQLLTVNEFKALNWLQRMQYILYRSAPVLFLLGPMWYILVNNRIPLIRLKGWEHAHRALLLNNLYLVLIHTGVVALLGYEALLFVHFPILVAFGIIAIWFFYVQHQHEFTYKQWKDRWDYVLAAVQGSTYYKLPRLMHWLTGNIGYHHIHHLNSLVPSYQLARCQRENPILDEIAVKITFWESLKCIFNKLWDEDQRKMISFREFYRKYKRG